MDRESMHELVRLGGLGGRFRCLQGCTDRWIRFATPPAPARPIAPGGQGHYPRKYRRLVCEDCGQGFLSKGFTAKRCPPCRQARTRLYDYQRKHPEAATG